MSKKTDTQSIKEPKSRKTPKDWARAVRTFFLSIPGRITAFIQPNGKFSKKNIAILATSILLVIALIVGAVFGGIALWGSTDDDPSNTTIEEEENDDFPSDKYGLSDAGSLNELLRAWAQTGTPVQQNYVINVLLIGVDSRKEGGEGRSDAMILVSVNKQTKKITLASFPRDSYTYMQIKGEDRYDKVNHSYVWGGADALVPTLENAYKIKIDHWAAVDFVTFSRVVDILGGVNITVTEAESKEVNNHPKTYGKVTLPFGENIKLNGRQALTFSRIRHLGSDVARTERQRKMITQLIGKAKGASLDQLTKIAGELLKNVKTDIGLVDFTALGTQALSGGWAGFDIASLEVPDSSLRLPTLLPGTYANPNRNISVYVIDYPRGAYDLQMRLYGQSNIVIDENTPNALALLSPPPKPTNPPTVYVPRTVAPTVPNVSAVKPSAPAPASSAVKPSATTPAQSTTPSVPVTKPSTAPTIPPVTTTPTKPATVPSTAPAPLG
ncbi:MAG: LCP family protein [Oscillospiraceae bacterium]|jgi:LCP family protein required for cell wall assembly|nr:LCP family protein [Oscillospiraceae bacterium]